MERRARLASPFFVSHLMVFDPSSGVSKVSDDYLLSPDWLALPVLFSETVSEGCGAFFCCVCGALGAAGFAASF